MPGASPLLLGCRSPFLSAQRGTSSPAASKPLWLLGFRGARFSGAGSRGTRWRLQDDGQDARAGAVSAEAAGDKGGEPGRGGGAGRAVAVVRRGTGAALPVGCCGDSAHVVGAGAAGGSVGDGRLEGGGRPGATLARLVLPQTRAAGAHRPGLVASLRPFCSVL